MRVALTHVYGWPEVRRGAERYVHELGAALHRAGHDVRIVTTGRPGRDVVLDVPVRRLRRRGALLRSRYGELGDQVAFGLQTLGRVGTSRVDVWHAVSTTDAAAAAVTGRLRPGLRSVFTECGFPARRSRSARTDHGLYRAAVRWVDEFVCLSQPAADLLADGYGRPARVVPAGVDLQVFRPDGERAREPVLLFPGALDEPRKNVARFLEALALLRRDGHAVTAWLVGPGRLPADLSPLAREGRGAVSRQGEVRPDELPDLYRRAWATVLPSDAEVFGLVVLESLACGTPAVVLDDGLGPAALVTQGTGIRCGPTDRDLATACLEALELAQEADTRRACAARAAGFSWDTAVVPMLLELYRG